MTDPPDSAQAQAVGQPTGDAQGDPNGGMQAKRGESEPATKTKSDPATSKSEPAAKSESEPAPPTEQHQPTPPDQDVVAYEASLASTAGVKATLITGMAYCWWLLIGGTFEILFGGMYLGTSQQAQIHVSATWTGLFYVVLGTFMVTLGFGILRQESWVYWGGWLGSLGLAGASIYEIVRWATGTPIALETAFFAGLNNVYFLLQPDTRKALH